MWLVREYPNCQIDNHLVKDDPVLLSNLALDKFVRMRDNIGTAKKTITWLKIT